MKHLRVIVLCHEDLVPPETREGHSEKEFEAWKTEFGVVETLRELGHAPQVIGVSVPTPTAGPLIAAISGFLQS